MVYRKNIYRWEQIFRLAVGAAMAIYGVFAMPGAVMDYLVIATGAFVALTGLFGFCPACAMVGRKLK